MTVNELVEVLQEAMIEEVFVRPADSVWYQRLTDTCFEGKECVTAMEQLKKGYNNELVGQADIVFHEDTKCLYLDLKEEA